MTVLGRARGRRPRSTVLTVIVPSDGAIREPGRMGMSDTNAFVGLDVHKEQIAVAIADAGRDGEVRFWGTVPN